METGTVELQQDNIVVNENPNWNLAVNIRHTIIYPALLISISLAVNYFFVSYVITNLPAANFIYAGAFLLMGLIHSFIFSKWLAHLWHPGFMYGTIYTIVLAVIISVAPPLLFSLGVDQVLLLAPVAISAFLLPYAFYATIFYFRSIGVRQYQPWFIPGDVEPDTRMSLLLNSIHFKIKMPIKYSDTTATQFVITLSPKLKLSTVFIRFLYEKHDVIEMTDSNGNPFGWLFSIKNRWGKKMLDPDLTLNENGVQEDDFILVERVME